MKCCKNCHNYKCKVTKYDRLSVKFKALIYAIKCQMNNLKYFKGN